MQIRTAGIEDLEGHSGISIAFLVERVLLPTPGGRDLDLVEQPVGEPWWKDYDAEPGASPASWPRRFDTSSWCILSAWHGSRRVGGLVVLSGDASMDLLEARFDLALIWDLRITPAFRGRGVGCRLVGAAEDWARARGCTELKVETQNINVPACRFYQAQGFDLRVVRPDAYPGLPNELQLLWYKPLP